MASFKSEERYNDAVTVLTYCKALFFSVAGVSIMVVALVYVLK